MPENKVAIEMNEDKNIKPEGFNDKSLENRSYVWSDYVDVHSLTLDQSTIIRAREAGIGELLRELSRDALAAIRRLGIREYNYEDMAKIVGAVQNVVLSLQKRYHAPHIEIGSFVSPDTGALNTVYLSEFGILETIDQVNGREVCDTDPVEIWRYLYWPSKVVENVVSTMIAVAEKHKRINEDWILSFQRINDLCLETEK
jgi:hypothetical protein